MAASGGRRNGREAGWAQAAAQANEDVEDAVGAGVVHVLYGAPLIPLLSGGSQLWHQGAPGVLGTAETGDRFGSVLPNSRF